MSRHQQHEAGRLRLVPVVLGLGVILAVTGCSAGQTAQTQSEVAAVNGGSATVGQIDVQNAEFTFPASTSFYPPGASAPLQVVLINGGTQGDQLLSASSPYAASVQISGDTNLPAGTSVRALGIPQISSAPTSSPATSSSTPSSAPSSATTAPRPAPGATPVGLGQVQITVVGLKQRINPGVTIPVTFVFSNAGPVTVQVPISEDPRARQERDSPGPY